MVKRVLEVNVDDNDLGGVYALVKRVIENNKTDLLIDIAAIERFKNKDNIDRLMRHNCTVYYIGCDKGKIKKQVIVYKKLKELIVSERFECVHIHGDTSNKLLISGLAAKHVGVSSIILHSHSAGIDGDHRIVKRIIHIVCRRMLRRVGTTFVACSDYAANWMYRGVNEVRIIKNGIDLKEFKYNKRTRDKVRKELEVSDKIVIGHVGRFLYQKNHEYLIDIIESVIRKKIDAVLLMIGSGNREDEIKRMVTNRELQDYVIFYGTSNNVNELMQAMDIFVLPSRFEGLPIVGVEAQASGLPVILSDTITKQTQLTDNVYFMPIKDEDVVLWAETIEKISVSEIDRERCCSELKEKGFDIEDTVNSFMKLYMG